MKERPTPEQVVFVIDDDASVRDSLKNLLDSVGLQPSYSTRRRPL
jgi:FixJ family two-component response regulator